MYLLAIVQTGKRNGESGALKCKRGDKHKNVEHLCNKAAKGEKICVNFVIFDMTGKLRGVERRVYRG